MPETFSPLVWRNDQTPAINETNLNRLEVGVEAIDDRVAAVENGIVTPVVVPFATSVTINATQGSLFRCVASADLTLDDIVGGTDGQTIVFEVQASGSGRTLHFTGSNEPVSISAGQWWVGIFRYIASGSTWLLDDGSGSTGGSVGNNGLNVLAPQNIPYAATITPNAALGALFRVTAVGDFTLAEPANGTDGQDVIVEVVASGGTRTVSFSGNTIGPIAIPSGSRWIGSARYNAGDNVWVLNSGSGGSSSGGYGIVQDEGSSLAARSVLNFTGSAVTVSDDTPNGRTNVVIASSSGYNTVQDEGSGLASRATLNFVGAGVTAADDAANSRTVVTIAGGGGSGYSTIQEEGSGLTSRATLNFIGRSVTAADNSGSTRTDVTMLDTVPVHAVGNSGTALTLDAASSSGPVKTITLTGNCTLTLSSVTSGREVWMVLVLTQDATGSRTVTWPGSVKWSGGAPVLTTTAAAVDRVLLTTYNGGTTWYGDLVGKAYA